LELLPPVWSSKHQTIILAKGAATATATTTNTATDDALTTTTRSHIIVLNRNAKELKTTLESLDYLDKTYRMTKAVPSAEVNLDNPQMYIAVPIRVECCNVLSVLDGDSKAAAAAACDGMPWLSLVVAHGRQAVPYSTAMLGNNISR